ncbi:phosphotransferase [Paenibacillus sp. 19GGS1-52]|uniref:aminoglycoside phosphotransferase family protein n=1 Tax=Paenibacillus sp. 19GGS1-52 TaxID=2758563 RepID=UPI001EFA2ECD|nr:aminoglycoside phosphotransferase family protein [Paenibacillus sp. 19GGS1-52]ULO09883.1 phosphotransferase [Paenibacillus sp. 19GGS1-52]
MIGKLIGIGNTAEVFAVGDGKVVKLFNFGYPLDNVCKEFDNSKLLHGLNIPTVKSYEMVTYEGRNGILYDRIDGMSMLDILLNTEDFEKYANTLARLHKQMLACKLRGAVSLKSILKRNIEYTDHLSMPNKSKLINMLDTLPDGDCFCHGDFHFGNVIIEQEQNYIIDYMNVCHGHEYGDIARTVYLIEMTPVPAQTHNAERILVMKKQATEIYLQEIGVNRECLSEWLLVIAAARLSELSYEQADEKNSVLEYLTKQGL